MCNESEHQSHCQPFCGMTSLADLVLLWASAWHLASRPISGCPAVEVPGSAAAARGEKGFGRGRWMDCPMKIPDHFRQFIQAISGQQQPRNLAPCPRFLTLASRPGDDGLFPHELFLDQSLTVYSTLGIAAQVVHPTLRNLLSEFHAGDRIRWGLPWALALSKVAARLNCSRPIIAPARFQMLQPDPVQACERASNERGLEPNAALAS